MVVRQARAFRVIQDRRRRAFFDNLPAVSVAVPDKFKVQYSTYFLVAFKSVFSCSQKKKMWKFFISGANMSVMFCSTSEPSCRASSNCPSMSAILEGTSESIMRRPIDASAALLLPLCGVPKNRIPHVLTKIECRCATSLLVRLCEYASAYGNSVGK